MKDTVSPPLFVLVRRSVHSLSGGGEGAGSQHLDLLRMMDLSSGVDCFLSSFKELLSEVSELQYFSFDERIP